ncbi:MAG: pyridoxal phosphate-dependent aminotransferase, partial [Muribaculaceae bacterium]|nr:pyridoxal phosphate-dependent aminotransferase [Muribaculaceae bacterium]
GSMKWDSQGDSPEVIPLWVADMDFRTAPVITAALRERVDTGIFGYTHVFPRYYKAICHWFEKRHNWNINSDRIIYTSGVVPAVSAIIKALAAPGEGVILQTPAYNCFFSSIRNNKCRIVENPLKRVDTSDGFTYELDFAGLEYLTSQRENTLLILCNPHNPTGRVWTREELNSIRRICRRNGVRVISDEIHCELIHPGAGTYIPYATVDSEAVICTSPSKAFNTAGLQIANIICPDHETQRSIDRAINDNEVCDVNPFGVVGLEAAYNHGEEWLEALNNYLYGNYSLLRNIFKSRMPELPVSESQSTYLAWIDISKLGISADKVQELLLEKAFVRIASGAAYGDNNYIRINYACQRSRLTEALVRIAEAIENYI